jgi:hypothetical protein
METFNEKTLTEFITSIIRFSADGADNPWSAGYD